MDNPQEKTLTIKSAVDLNIVGENIRDIADFAVEKYEFVNDVTLSDEVREAAVARVRDDLWSLMKAFKAKRQEWNKRLFDTADKAVREVAAGS